MMATSDRPYRGLNTFSERESDIFCGRDEDTRLLVANLFASPVTILHGPPGVGKSSVLQAGVLPLIRRKEYKATPVYFRSWGENWLLRFQAQCREALKGTTVHQTDSFYTFMRDFAARNLIIVILDQFEDYLDGSRDQRCDKELARAIRDTDVRASFLIGIREDRFAGLDCLKSLVPKLLDRTLRLDLLTTDSARAAITGPLELPQFNAKAREDLIEYYIDGRDKIPPAELQIVFDQQWDIDRTRDPIELCLESYPGRYRRHQAVQSFINMELSRSLGADREIGSRILEMLVPESGIRATRTLEGLAREIEPRKDFDEDAVRLVRRILDALCKAKMLRVDFSGYTIYHDVTQESIRAWCQAQRETARSVLSAVTSTEEHRREVERKNQEIRELTEACRKAQDDARVAQSRELAARALLFEKQDPQQSVRLAMRSLAGSKDGSLEAADLLFRLFVEGGTAVEAEMAEAPGLLAKDRNDGLVDLYRTSKDRPDERWKTLAGLGGPVTGLVFSADGTRLAARTAGSPVRVWDLGTGQEITTEAAARTPFSSAEIEELYRRARELVGFAEPEKPREAPLTEEPEYLPFLAQELLEKTHADAKCE
jgi:hypothetical protein